MEDTPRYRASRRAAWVFGGLLLFGCTVAVGAHAAPSPTSSPLPALPWSVAPIVTPVPLPVPPPQIVVEAGVLPGGLLSVLDHFAELLDRTLFSFGLPSLRARVALTQAAERIAELQALERNGELTPSALHALLTAHARLIEIGNRVVARQIAAGRQPTALLVLLVRTRLAAAQVLHDVQGQLSIESRVDVIPTPTPSPVVDLEGRPSLTAPAEVPEDLTESNGSDEAGTTFRELAQAIDALVDLEGDLLPPDGTPVSPAVLHVLAEQKVSLAERELLAAIFTVEERFAHRRVVIADAELRAVAESLLVTARELSAAGNDREALALATAVRGVIARLASEAIAVEPEQLLVNGDVRAVTDILDGLVDEGVIGLPERATAELRARQTVEQLRRDTNQ